MTKPSRFLAAASVALLGTLVSAGCSASTDQASPGSDSSAPASPSAPASSGGGSGGPKSSATATVTIKNFAYSGPSSVAPGTKVTVTNQDSQAHTLTAEGGKQFDVKIAPGASATFTAPTKAGSYSFICLYHSNMSGTLKVA